MWKKKVVVWLVLVWMVGVMCVGVVGCKQERNEETGKVGWSLDEEKYDDVEEKADLASQVLALLGVVWPVLLPVAGYIGGAVRVSRKLKPQLVAIGDEVDMYYSAASVVVNAIDEFKKEYPKEWIKLEGKLEKVIGDKTGNVIRALRGLPPIN